MSSETSEFRTTDVTSTVDPRTARTRRRRRRTAPRATPGAPTGSARTAGVGSGGPPAPAGALRPELRWEVLDIPGGGRYVARRVPVAELLTAAADAAAPGAHAGAQGAVGAVLVVETHDLGLAAVTAWPLWHRHVPGRRLSRPTAGWWRRLPADPSTADPSTADSSTADSGTPGGVDRGVGHMWWPARAGTPGAVPAVEFTFPGDEIAGGGR